MDGQTDNSSSLYPNTVWDIFLYLLLVGADYLKGRILFAPFHHHINNRVNTHFLSAPTMIWDRHISPINHHANNSSGIYFVCTGLSSCHDTDCKYK